MVAQGSHQERTQTSDADAGQQDAAPARFEIIDEVYHSEHKIRNKNTSEAKKTFMGTPCATETSSSDLQSLPLDELLKRIKEHRTQTAVIREATSAAEAALDEEQDELSGITGEAGTGAENVFFKLPQAAKREIAIAVTLECAACVQLVLFPTRNGEGGEGEGGQGDYTGFAQFEAVHRSALMAAHDVVARRVYAAHGVSEAAVELAVRSLGNDAEYQSAERALGGALRRVFWPPRVVELWEGIEPETQLEALRRCRDEMLHKLPGAPAAPKMERGMHSVVWRSRLEVRNFAFLFRVFLRNVDP